MQAQVGFVCEKNWAVDVRNCNAMWLLRCRELVLGPLQANGGSVWSESPIIISFRKRRHRTRAKFDLRRPPVVCGLARSGSPSEANLWNETDHSTPVAYFIQRGSVSAERGEKSPEQQKKGMALEHFLRDIHNIVRS